MQHELAYDLDADTETSFTARTRRTTSMYRAELEREARLIAQGQQLIIAEFAQRWQRLLAWFRLKG
jgi:hypothetical protein